MIANRRGFIKLASALGVGAVSTAIAVNPAAAAVTRTQGNNGSKRPPLIDVHSHALVDLGDGKDAGTNIPIGFIPPWSPAGAIAIMDQYGIATSIVSMPDGGTHFDDATNITRARQLNEYLANLVSTTPSRRGSMAVLPLTTIDGSLAELTYALDVLKMDAVSLPASVKNVYLGDAQFDPLFEELNRRKATVFVHPVQPPAGLPLNLGLNQSILEFPFDTTRMILNMITSGATLRFPNVKMIASHGGGTFPYLLTRIQTIVPVTGSGPGRAPLTPAQILAGAQFFYYDLTSATSIAHLTALAQIVPTSQLLMGFDIPFLPQATIAPTIQDVLTWKPFKGDDVKRIFHDNAAALFPMVEARRRPADKPLSD